MCDREDISAPTIIHMLLSEGKEILGEQKNSNNNKNNNNNSNPFTIAF